MNLYLDEVDMKALTLITTRLAGGVSRMKEGKKKLTCYMYTIELSKKALNVVRTSPWLV